MASRFKEILASVQAKRLAKYQEKQKQRAAQLALEKNAKGDGAVFSEDEVDAMERACDARLVEDTSGADSAKKV